MNAFELLGQAIGALCSWLGYIVGRLFRRRVLAATVCVALIAGGVWMMGTRGVNIFAVTDWIGRANLFGQSKCQLPLTKTVEEQNGVCEAVTALASLIFKAKADGGPDLTQNGRTQVGPDFALRVKGLYRRDPSFAEIEPTPWHGQYIKAVSLGHDEDFNRAR